MSMDSMLDAMRAEMDSVELKLIANVRERTAELRGQSWVNDAAIAGPAAKEARDSTEYYHMGLSKKILRAATAGLPPEQLIPVAFNVTAVMADRANIEMLDQLLLIAYLRGVAKAMELTGRELPASPKPEQNNSESSEQPEEICPHCGEVHGPETEQAAFMAEALQQFADLGKILDRMPGAHASGK